MEINWQKSRVLAGGPKPPLLKLMPPFVNLLARHIMPMRDMLDRRPIYPNRGNGRQLVIIIPAMPPLNT